MKRNSLTTALLAGLAGAAGLATTAQAVNLNPDGLGQVLIYPYYTVNKGNQTLISVVNTTSRVKAVKVRFLEGLNSREVLDFNLYLSPYDVWTGAVFATGATGPASLVTRDNSCTVPRPAALTTTGVPFRNFGYSGTHDDEGGTSLERTREGYLEMIEMGVVNGTQATAATHNAAGVPGNGTGCTALVNNWAIGGTWANNFAANIELPAGGLYGAETIVDVANGTMHANNADAIEGFYLNAAAPAALHSNPGTTFPSLRDANSGAGVASSFVFTSTGTLVRSDWVVGTADAVSAVYLHDAIYNEFNTEPGLGASSEWVVTFPTKRFYVDLEVQPLAPVRPFTTVFQDNGAACEPVTIGYYDREEQAPGPASLDFSPPPPGAPGNSLCFEAQVVAFNQANEVTAGATKIFGSTYAANINTALGTGTANAGWARLTFETSAQTPTIGHVLGPSIDGDFYAGLPVTGFWSANYINSSAAPGLLANYSGSYRHRASRVISGT
jgi:hypothetical protein